MSYITSSNGSVANYVVRHRLLRGIVTCCELPGYLKYTTKTERQHHWSEYKDLKAKTKLARDKYADAIMRYNYINSFQPGKCSRQIDSGLDNYFFGTGGMSHGYLECPVNCLFNAKPDCELACPLRQEQKQVKDNLDVVKNEYQHLRNMKQQFWARKVIER